MLKKTQEAPVKSGVVYVVDDDEAMRDSLTWLLESNGFKVSCHESAERFLMALASTDRTTVACALLDMRLPGMSGIELQNRLQDEGYHFPLTVITGYGEVKLAVQAIKQGATDFLEKPFKEDQLYSVVEKMLSKAYIDQQQNLEIQTAQSKLKTLTRREKEVLKCLVDGCTNKQIGEVLKISLKTVEAHRANVMDKLGVNRAATLLKLAITHNF
ncbi:response regulator transcription factor [Polynucleobacter asymbioticus]|jgi:FixJ family two-component response regulator|uniref:DNA-binding response regulator n=1 Tax=Polynucleobacter asymbioticus TaxID=576611 RepID=A0AAC9IXS4_9BURK|nr:response regulator [Polynucleobacter asymbioticus]APB99088.1 DNA-binding response regulator [Polynucleobacter asymbioticus]APC01388.1 DNA-binding response regulator [Polynucleobacter asymbioticus]